MDGRGTLAQDEAFMKLQEHRNQQGDNINIANLFASDSDRFSKFRWEFRENDGIFLKVTLIEVIWHFCNICEIFFLYQPILLLKIQYVI